MIFVILLDGNGTRVRKTYSQAEALLRGEAKMKHGNWVLPDDSPYEFKDNGFIRRTNKRTAGTKTTRRAARTGEESREQTKDALRDDTKEE